METLKTTETFHIDENGYYGDFGGCFVSDALKKPIEELRQNYLRIITSDKFQKEYRSLLKDFVGRPSPLYLAPNLSKKYNCKIYLKREDLNHTGAHKINNALGQILLARMMGKSRIIAETGAGQHGVAVATACALMNMKCTIYMGQADIERQRSNVMRIKMLGGELISARSGNMTLNNAINEALAEWSKHADDTYYLMGSAAGPHPFPDIVARLQSVISEEIQQQMMEHENRPEPDYLIACIGGGSNAAGTIYHFIDNPKVNIILAEAGGEGAHTGKTAATMTVGKVGILHGSKTLVLKTPDDELAEAFSISAGLDYPGVGPMFANLYTKGRIKVFAITDDEALDAGMELARTEGIIPALESAHAIGVLGKMKFKKDDVVVITVSGRGDKDIDTYIRYRC